MSDNLQLLHELYQKIYSEAVDAGYQKGKEDVAKYLIREMQYTRYMNLNMDEIAKCCGLEVDEVRELEQKVVSSFGPAEARYRAGYEEGRKKAGVATAARMLMRGKSIEEIKELTGLESDELDEVREIEELDELEELKPKDGV